MRNMYVVKRNAICNFLDFGKVCSFGNLRCVGDSIYTYNVKLAHVDRENRVVTVNTKRYSVTSSGHRNLVLSVLSGLDDFETRTVEEEI